MINSMNRLKSTASILCSILLLFSFTTVLAQTGKNDNTIFLNSEIPDNEEFLNFMVNKAYDYYPEKDQYDYEIEIAKKEKTLANVDFLNNIMIRGNLNEYTINPPDGPGANNLFFPRYNFSIGFTLGTFFTQPINKKIAKQNYFIKQSEQEVYDIQLKTEVLIKYSSFKSAKTIYIIQNKALDDVNSKLSINEDQFKNDQISYEDYLSVLTEVNKQKITTILAQREYEIAKIELEQLIGEKIELIIQQYKLTCD